MRFLLIVCVAAFFSARAQQTAAPAPRVPGDEMAARLLTKVPPVYPREAKDSHVGGFVVVHAIISREGLVRDPTVVSGPAMLCEAAMDAIKQWAYKPYLRNGVPTEVDTTITVNLPFPDAVPAPTPGSLPGNTAAAQLVPPSPVPGRVRLASNVMAGQKLSGNMPNFCVLAGGQHVPTVVSLHVMVDRTGNIAQAEVLNGAPALRQTAIEAVGGWTYKPSLLNGSPVEVDTVVTMSESCGS